METVCGHHKATRHSCMYGSHCCGLRELESRTEAILTLKPTAESGDPVLLPLSERTTSSFNR
jgi:hypothetical protein